MVMEALDRIPEKYKILIDLRLIQDLKFSQIANILALDETITRVYFNRGLKALNKEYEKILREVANEK